MEMACLEFVSQRHASNIFPWLFLIAALFEPRIVLVVRTKLHLALELSCWALSLLNFGLQISLIRLLLETGLPRIFARARAQI